MRPRIGIAFDSVEPALMGADLAIITGAAAAGALACLTVDTAAIDVGSHVGLGMVGSLAYALAAHRWGLYRFHRLLQGRGDLTRIAVCWLWMVSIVALVSLLTKEETADSGAAIVCGAILANIGLLSWRGIARTLVRAALARGAIRGRKAVLIGTGDQLQSLDTGDLLLRYGLDEIGRFELPEDTGGDLSAPDAIIARALDHARACAADEMILALSWERKTRLALVLDRLRHAPLPIRLLPDCSTQSLVKRFQWNAHALPLVDMRHAAAMAGTDRMYEPGPALS